jgi:hypothetical protein
MMMGGKLNVSFFLGVHDNNKLGPLDFNKGHQAWLLPLIIVNEWKNREFNSYNKIMIVANSPQHVHFCNNNDKKKKEKGKKITKCYLKTQQHFIELHMHFK